ncbi:hypothetical protein PRUPE_8G056500 [Prunus persica]|uniref:Uncharacterized protein n=1 Tax=Prunus persica TaxID=3760 RepID=M5W205_PRUPE|nr:hypothetical protein PRUPE_8G056500 [Prunus persica]
MDDFKEAISDCCFKEIPFLGSPFTWSRGSGGSLVKEHLDRDASDHAPLVLHAEIHAPATTFRKWRFHFEAMWANEEGYRNTILEAWGEASCQSLPLTNKFLLCTQRLNSWGQQQFGSLPKQIQQCYLELQNLDLDAPNFDPTRKHELSVKLDDLLEKEEIFWKQRSRVQWLQEGDWKTHGLPALFFQKYWDIIGEDIALICLQILNNGKSIKEFNHTLVALIPKIKNVKNVKEFRPISLCNVIYKIVAKTLANCLKIILPEVISSVQSASIPGKYIIDNVTLAFELMHTVKKQKQIKEPKVVVKLDVSKAYDRVERNFLRKIMKKLGFATRWVDLIMECVTTVTYSIINLLTTYEKAAGQRINFENSTMAFGPNSNIQLQSDMQLILGIPLVQFHEKYLGLPMVVGQAKKALFVNLRNRVGKLLQGWKGHAFVHSSL